MKVVIHSTAIVAKEALIGAGVEIGPYTVVGPHVQRRIGDKKALKILFASGLNNRPL